jgi:hypothetical protein
VRWHPDHQQPEFRGEQLGRLSHDFAHMGSRPAAVTAPQHSRRFSRTFDSSGRQYSDVISAFDEALGVIEHARGWSRSRALDCSTLS